MNSSNSSLDNLISETLFEMNSQASTAKNVVSLEKNKKRLRRNSLVAVAASIILISAISVSIMFALQTSSDSDSTNVINKPIENVTTTTTSPDNETDDTVTDNNDKPNLTAKPNPDGSIPNTSEPADPNIVEAPTNFEAYDHYKNAFGWYVKLSWTSSTTPGVSYCYFIDLTEMNSSCEYDSNFTGNSGDFSVGIGNVSNNTFYLRAVKPNGEKSEIVTVKYQIPA